MQIHARMSVSSLEVTFYHHLHNLWEMAVFATYENLPCSKLYDYEVMPLDFFTLQKIFVYYTM